MTLTSLSEIINEFERAAFLQTYPNLKARKAAMRFATTLCGDQNLKDILAGSTDYIAKRPEQVRAAISKARGHIETLRANGHV